MPDSRLLTCYNRGCGKNFDPSENKEDSCTYHPGLPFFHDAYKGWSCCNKKCTDFTEFLNIKGCTISYHSDVKPPEAEKPARVDIPDVCQSEPKPKSEPEPKPLIRPSFDTPTVTLKPNISPVLMNQTEPVSENSVTKDKKSSSEIPLDTPCKNSGCKKVYEGINSLNENCIHHPGYPVFHEGLKFWTCCQKRTTDFNSFLQQEGCSTGRHIWFKDKGDSKIVQCRYDWHQTGGNVIVSIYAKKYSPSKSVIELSPVRLKIHLHFPEEQSSFDLDLELRGVVCVENSSVSMSPVKVEIKLRKAEALNWSHLDFPKLKNEPEETDQEELHDLTCNVDAVDLSDL